MHARVQSFDATLQYSGNAVKLEISRTGIFSFRNNSAVPPVEIMSTPWRSRARANEAIPACRKQKLMRA